MTTDTVSNIPIISSLFDIIIPFFFLLFIFHSLFIFIHFLFLILHFQYTFYMYLMFLFDSLLLLCIGIGPKTALRLIKQHGRIEDIVAALIKVK